MVSRRRHEWLAYWVVALACHGVLLARVHGHAACGHSRVANQASHWSQLHRQHRQLLQQRLDQAAPTTANSTDWVALDGQQASISPADKPQPRLLAEATVPIRIWVEYQGVIGLSAEGKQHLYDTVNIALGVLQKFYKVRRPAPGRLTVQPFCLRSDGANGCSRHQPDFLSGGNDNTCGSASINNSHIASYEQCSLGGFSCNTFPGGPGEYTDYYLYITAQQDDHCASGAVAWALPCLYDEYTNRPLLGSANICPDALMNSEPESGVAVLVHELTHALGFTDEMFDKFIDAEGGPIPESSVVQQYVDAYGRTTAMVITPTVVKETRAQFNCDKLPGAALENEGGRGSANAHWEYRWFQGELMVATNLFAVYGKPATLSRITLAFMQDTGWYDINWEYAGFLDWGYQAGCDFAAKTCTDYIAANPDQQYYCTKDQIADNVNTVCAFDALARAKCEDAQFADGCIMKVALGTSPNCLNKRYTTVAGDKFGWQNGLSSRCMPVTWLFNTYAYQFPDSTAKSGWKDSMCYKSTCTAEGQLLLDILGNNVSCPTGQTIDLAKALPNQFTKGTIGPCPDNNVICNSLSCAESCTVGGTCVSGKCYCNLQYTGADCSKKLTPSGNYTTYEPVVDDAVTPGQAYDNGYLMMSARLQNEQSELYLSLDRYKNAVAQLAGVTSSRVAVLSFLADAPATSLIGHRRRLTAVSQLQAIALPALPAWSAGAAAVELISSSSSGHGGNSSSSTAMQHVFNGLARQLLQAKNSGQLEVYSRISTLNQADADAITGRINNATRQADFAKQLSDAGLQLVPGSVTVRASDSTTKGWGLPSVNMDDPNTRRIIIIVACSVGAALLVMVVGWVIVCCMRRRRSRSRLQQQFIAGGAPTAAYAASSGRNNGSRTNGSGVRPLFGTPATSGQLTRQGSAQLHNPFAGTNIRFDQHPASAGHTAYAAPPAAATNGLPVGGYVVAGQTFRTAKEAEDYQVALALQRSLQQSGPPGHYLPHSDVGNGMQRAQRQQQQRPPTGYPTVGYAVYR